MSSNIGVSHVIDKNYGKEPERYVKGLYRVGIHEDLKLPLVGYLPPRIRMPEKNKRGQYTNWSKTALPWMSIGYETQIAPINTVTFYNAIANNGKMMRPRFVKKVMKNGETIAEYPPEVIRERIAKPKAIETMQTILEHVVSQGLGRKAGSPLWYDALLVVVCRLFPCRQSPLFLYCMYQEVGTASFRWWYERRRISSYCRRSHGPLSEIECRRCSR